MHLTDGKRKKAPDRPTYFDELEPVVTDAMLGAGERALAMSPDGVDSISPYSCFRAMVLAEPRYVRSLKEAGLLRGRAARVRSR